MNEAETLVDGLSSVALFFRDLDEPIKIGKREICSLVHILSRVKGFRCPGKTVYRLENLLAICFLMSMKGQFQSFYFTSEYVRIHHDEFIELGLIENGKVPSHDTFRRVFGHLDASGLRDAFLDKIREFLDRLTRRDPRNRYKKKILSGDGKTFNGSGRGGGARNLNVFNLFDASDAVCLTSAPLADKDSEIPEFQRLLARYDLSRYMVTADALHCQRETCSIILHRKGGYVFKVKLNQAGLLSEIVSCFERTERFGKRTTLEHNNCDYEFITLPASYVGCAWPGQKTFVRMISHKRRKQKDYNPEPQYFVSSESSVQLIAEAIDNRWQIEDGLHRFKDQVLGEDNCTFMDQNAVKVMATINNTVYSLYRIASSVLGHKSMTETRIRFMDDPLALLATVLPLLEKKNLTELIRANMRGRKPKAQ